MEIIWDKMKIEISIKCIILDRDLQFLFRQGFCKCYLAGSQPVYCISYDFECNNYNLSTKFASFS